MCRSSSPNVLAPPDATTSCRAQSLLRIWQPSSRGRNRSVVLREAMNSRRPIRAVLLALLFAILLPERATLRAQEGQESNPAAALTSALVAACRQSDAGFAHYLTAESGEAFQALAVEQRKT